MRTCCAVMLGTLTASAVMSSPLAAQHMHANLGDLTCSVLGDAPAAPAGTNSTGESQSESTKAQEAICSFRSVNGTEEMYVATLQSASPLAVNGGSFAWSVRGPSDVRLDPGALAQTFTRQARPDAPSPLVGKESEGMLLYPVLADTGEAEKGTAPETQISVLALTLRTSTAGLATGTRPRA